MTERVGRQVIVTLPVDLAHTLDVFARSEDWDGVDHIVTAALQVLMHGEAPPPSQLRKQLAKLQIDIVHAIHAVHETCAQIDAKVEALAQKVDALQGGAA